MIDIKSHTILFDAPISEALEKLNLPYHLKTVFVINQNNQVIGTITDGDIRRGLLNGIDFSEKCEKFAFKDFKFLQLGKISIEQLIIWRERQINILPLLNHNQELIEILNFNELKSFLPLTAVIMAGGFGNRLRPLTLNTPKPMLKIGDFPIFRNQYQTIDTVWNSRYCHLCELFKRADYGLFRKWRKMGLQHLLH